MIDISQKINQLNQLPINQYIAKILLTYQGCQNDREINALQLLRLMLEEGTLCLDLRPGGDLERTLMDLILMQPYDPQRASDLLELETLKVMPPQELAEELVERLNVVEMEELI